MGLLDDAIREHLELKRRHGAGEDEVRRQEQEALGPPLRGEVPQPLSPPPPPGDDEVVADEEPAAPPPPLEDAAPQDLAPPLSADEPTVVAPADDEVWFDEPAEEPPAAYAASDLVDPGEPGPDDVLEETPEFLQETPEHDRLWFEQKPPKDFDFDK
jgi:hypothetical protein